MGNLLRLSVTMLWRAPQTAASRILEDSSLIQLRKEDLEAIDDIMIDR
jgi:hypothetical protein